MKAANGSVKFGTVRSEKDKSCFAKGSEASARIVKTEAQNVHLTPPLRCENAFLGLKRMRSSKDSSGPRLTSSKI